ncbi:MAG: SET domain-containing protein [Patescibacteria group bacterium]
MKNTEQRPKTAKYQLRVGKSITGKGLFALESIPKGVRIIEYIGREIPPEMQYTSRSKYLFEITEKKWIDGNIPENIAKYVNHSCRPNCEVEIVKQHIYIYSKRKILPGEELTYDYGKEYFDEILKPIGCKCVKCREKANV